MSSLGLELLKNINIEENNNQTNNFVSEKPHVQFKETNEIIEPSESSQVDSTTIMNNENPLFTKQQINEVENVDVNNTIKNNISIKNDQHKNIPQQESNQEDSIVITNNKTQPVNNKQLIQRNLHSNNQTELKSNLKENTQIIKPDQIITPEQPTNYKKFIPNMQTIIFTIILIVIIFIIYKYINANAKLLETKVIEFQDKQKMFKTE